MKYIDIVDIKTAVKKGMIEFTARPDGSILCMDTQNGEAVLVRVADDLKQKIMETPICSLPYIEQNEKSTEWTSGVGVIFKSDGGKGVDRYGR